VNAVGDETTYTYGSGNTTTLPDTVTVGANTDDTTNAPAVVTSYGLDYANKRVNSVTKGGTQTCYLYDSAGRVTTTTVQAAGTCPTGATNASTTVKYGVLGLAAETSKPAPTAADANRTSRSGAAFSGTGRVRQNGGPDPATGFLPPLAADAGSETCKRTSDGLFPVPGVDVSGGPQCGSRKFTVTAMTYYPAGETKTVTDELGKVTTTVINRGVTDTTTAGCGAGVTVPCRTVITCGNGVTVCTITVARDTSQPNVDISATVTDAFGYQVQSISAGGATTKTTYGILGRVDRVDSAPPSTSPTAAGTVTKYFYDDNGQLTITQAGTNDAAPTTREVKVSATPSATPADDSVRVLAVRCMDVGRAEPPPRTHPTHSKASHLDAEARRTRSGSA